MGAATREQKIKNMEYQFTQAQLDSAISKGIETYVNGNIRKVLSEVKDLRDDLSTFKAEHKKHVDVVQPIIEQFNDRKGFIKTVKSGSAIVGAFAGIIIGVGVIITWLANNFNLIPK